MALQVKSPATRPDDLLVLSLVVLYRFLCQGEGNRKQGGGRRREGMGEGETDRDNF